MLGVAFDQNHQFSGCLFVTNGQFSVGAAYVVACGLALVEEMKE